MMLQMHDLAGADPDLRFSPYCWRTRFAAAHKGLPLETIPWRFTDREALAFSGQARVPVLRDGERVVFDSWAIAEYLEATTRMPTLFGGVTGQAHARFVNTWADTILLPAIAPLIIGDIMGVIAPEDQAYFRESREQRFGRSLEEVQADRDTRVSAFRQVLLPVRHLLRVQPWIGGTAPSYADHIVLGTMMWPRCVSRFELLQADDPVAAYMERGLDLYGGLGRNAPRA
ncbi:MAG: glutathione S-transferase family protein [Rhodospirillales bacterium]|nr:glutathione S-transferase family protein [Rhodospirillales bacterium]